MMSRRKKMWRGLAFAVAVAVLAEGVARMPVLEAAGNGVQQTPGVSAEQGEENSGTGKSSKTDIIKNVIPDMGGTGGSNTGVLPGNNTGEGSNSSGTTNGNGTGSLDNNGPAGGDGTVNDGKTPSTGNPVTDGSTNTDSAGSVDENSDKKTEPNETGNGGTGSQPSETPGTGNDGSGDTKPGTDEGNGDGGEKPGTDEGNGDGGDKPGTDEGNGDSEDKPGTDEGNGDGEDKPGTDEGNGDGEDKPGTDEGNGDGEDKDPAPDDSQQKNTIVIDGKEVPFNDFAEIWKDEINGQTVEVKLDKDIQVTFSDNTADSICKLTGGNVTLDLNGCVLSYRASSGRSGSGRPDLISVTGGTLTVKDSGGRGAIRYSGNSSYSGSCLYAGSKGTLNIEGGTFSSTASAPVYIDGEEGATLNVDGEGSSDISISAVTMNNGKLDISGDRAKVGTLTLNRSRSDMQVNLGKGSSFSSIESKGSSGVEAFKMSELLAEGCGFRSGGSSGSWITDEARLSGTSIRSVIVDTKPFTSLSLQVSPALENGSHLEFSYNGDKSYTLTAEVKGGTSEEPKYQWYRTYNGTRQEVESTGKTCTFSNKDDAGTYVYHVEVSVGNYKEEATFEVTIDPLSPGTITNKNYETTYTYGKFVAPPVNGGSSFSIDSGNVETGDFEWSYIWYKGSAADGNAVNAPSDAGNYILRVEAADGPNYKAVGDIPVTITQCTVTPVIEGTTSKVYDGTTEAKGAEVVLENVVQGDEGGVGVKVESIAYNDANARLANRIVASGIELTGNKSGNYILSDTQATVEADISKAELLIQMNVSPNTQKINRPVTVTVTVLNSDNSPIDNNGLKAEDVVLAVSGRNDTEEEHTLSLKASGSQYGVYTAEYTTDIKGDKTFTAKIGSNANYEVKNVASDNSLTILEKTGTVMKLTASETEDIVYGDEVTYTAVVSKENEDDADSLSGTVQFYEEEVADDNKIGSAQSITTSGGKVSITLDESVLEAGDHKILAVFSGSRSFEDVSAEVSTSVAKKQLTWDASGLSASKAAGTAGEVTVYGELKLDGLLDEDDVTFKQPDVLKTNGMKSTEAGSYKVTVVSEDKEWKFDPEEPKNYELPEGDPEITAKVNAVKELPNPPADTEDGKKFKLIMEEGISTVPEGLQNTSFNTPAKIEQELKRVLTESGVYKEESTAVYDVVLQVSTDEGTTWQVADYTNFPEGGLTVTMPYPGGTGRYTNNFAVAHMFSTSYFGKTSGQVEIPAVRKTDNGMEFTVTGLSPIGLAWSGPTAAVNNAVNGTAARRAQGALTWDDNPILLYACLAGGAALLIVIVAAVCVVNRGKKKKKSRR